MFEILFFQWPHWMNMNLVACAEAYSVPKDIKSTVDCARTAGSLKQRLTCTMR